MRAFLIIPLMLTCLACAKPQEEAPESIIDVHQAWVSQETGLEINLKEAGTDFATTRLVPLERKLCQAKVTLRGDLYLGQILIENQSGCLTQDYVGSYQVSGNKLILCIPNAFTPYLCNTFDVM